MGFLDSLVNAASDAYQANVLANAQRQQATAYGAQQQANAVNWQRIVMIGGAVLVDVLGLVLVINLVRK